MYGRDASVALGRAPMRSPLHGSSVTEVFIILTVASIRTTVERTRSSVKRKDVIRGTCWTRTVCYITKGIKVYIGQSALVCPIHTASSTELLLFPVPINPQTTTR